jgi:hypothetical protein
VRDDDRQRSDNDPTNGARVRVVRRCSLNLVIQPEQSSSGQTIVSRGVALFLVPRIAPSHYNSHTAARRGREPGQEGTRP